MMSEIRCLFFSGRFKRGHGHPDPDAKIGYCAAKKRAFVGYRVTIVNCGEHMPIVDYHLTPANRHDAHAVVPLLLSMEDHGILPKVEDFYGDNAYFTEKNKRWLEFYGKRCRFHSKEETGQHPEKERSARKKSQIRSKVESTFGIMAQNYDFGRTRVRGLENVWIETSLIFSAWNYFFLLSYLIDQFEDCISLRELLYEN